MNFEHTLKLIEAGFTADEIRKMMAGNDPEPSAADPEPPAADQETSKMDPELTRVLKGLQQSINNLDARLRASNMHDEIDDPGADTVDDYLAEIINPTFKEDPPKKGKR